MAVLDAIFLSRLDPWSLLGLERHFLDQVAARRTRPVLVLYSLDGRAISIGRYHLYDGPEDREGIDAYRRLTGGRVTGAGQGWLGIALILPSRTALLREQDSRLKPDQIMNRYARGALAALRAMGLDCFYPGRDAITVARREIAMCSFEVDASGALLFELILAVSRGMEDLVHDLERFDPEGHLPCAMYDRDVASTIARELKRTPEFIELAGALERGYADALGEIERRELTAGERAEGKRRGAQLRSSGWLHERSPDAALDKASRVSSQLGFVEAHLKLRSGGVIERLTLSGDFLANSSGLRMFEEQLAGQPFNLPTVSAAAMRTFGDGSNYILGIGEPANLVRLVMKAG